MNGVVKTVLLAVATTAVAGCDMSFDDPSMVQDLRILGLKADPPEFLGADYADLDRDVRISVLLADPLNEGKGGLECLLRACVLSNDYRCDDNDSTVVLAKQPCVDGSNTFQVTVPADLILATRNADPSWMAIEAGIAQAIDQGVPPEIAELGKSLYSGVAVWVEIVVSGGDHELRGLQSVIFSPENPKGRTANTNPTIAGVRLNGQVGGTVTEIPFSPGESIRVEVLKTWDSKETFLLPTYDPPGGVATVDEYMTFAFYADAGDFSPDTTTDKPPNIFNADPEAEQKPVDLWSTWTAPAADEVPADGVRFWFVLIDGRGGTDWITMKGVMKDATMDVPLTVPTVP
ncbi:MAG: hypothetical protein GXP54_04845 [Deltaproteobacteria bacterium]|nr:hypothetical protein [Deltaproteobacteria bacterium]